MDHSSRITLCMDRGWLFHNGEIENPPVEPRSVFAYHCMSKSNRARGAAAPSFDDREWERVTLPHDYVITGEVSSAEPSAHGSLARGNAWYRMHFCLEEEMRDRRCILEFDGVATNCQVWVNGHLLKHHRGAYIGFEVDFTDVAVYGRDVNTVAVHVEANEFEGWWYEGAGIYRHVRLVLKKKQHVKRWGVNVRSEWISGETWKVSVETELANYDYASAAVFVSSEVYDASGKKIASCESEQSMEARNDAAAGHILEVEKPDLWSFESPALYRLHTRVWDHYGELDECDTEFGFRTVTFSDEGMLVNGKLTKIRGACVHEDYGTIGTAIPDSVREYRLRELMKMGVNGIRCSHNPQSEEQFAICDRLGLMVMAEARWFESYGDGLEQLREMIRRDRNHPSIFFWSMGNEEPCQRLESGNRIMRAMRAEVRKLDKTRPCLLSMHTGLLEDGAVLHSDVIGMNYNEDKFEMVHDRFPGKAVIGSEMYSTSLDPEGDRSLGLYTCRMLDTLPYLVGIYIWTGIDYRGEHIYPTVISNAGAIDLNARPRDDFYLYQSMWTEEPMVRIHTHWNHNEGDTVEVFTYTNQKSVELFLNGKSLGKCQAEPYLPQTWRIPFEPGELRAFAEGDSGTAEHIIRTSGQADHLVLEPVLTGKRDCVILNITAADAADAPCLNDTSEIVFCVEGGSLLGACNGDICDETSPLAVRRKLYHGFCQLVIRPESEQVTVQAGFPDGKLSSQTVSCEIHGADQQVDALSNPCVTGWRQSEIYEECPDVFTLDPINWKPVASDIPCSWNFFDYKPIDCGMFEIDAWLCEYAMTQVPGSGKVLQFGEYCEGTKIYISREGRPRDEFVLEVETDNQQVVFDASFLEAGEKLHIFILLYAKRTPDGLNGPIRWR